MDNWETTPDRNAAPERVSLTNSLIFAVKGALAYSHVSIHAEDVAKLERNAVIPRTVAPAVPPRRDPSDDFDDFVYIGPVPPLRMVSDFVLIASY